MYVCTRNFVRTSDCDREVEPGLTELVLSQTCVASRVVLVYRIDLQ